MGSNKETSSQLDMDAKWNACVDITLRRLVYSSLAGACSALMLFRRPPTRWAAMAFGAGLGLGSAYTDCSHIFDGPLPKWQLPPNVASSFPLSSSASSKASQD